MKNTQSGTVKVLCHTRNYRRHQSIQHTEKPFGFYKKVSIQFTIKLDFSGFAFSNTNLNTHPINSNKNIFLSNFQTLLLLFIQKKPHK